MRHLLIAGVIVLTSAASATAQTQALEVTQSPLNVRFLAQAQVEEVLTTIARLGSVTIEFDATVTEAMLGAPLAKEILLRGATLEQAITAITSSNGLTYTVIGPTAIRISKRA